MQHYGFPPNFITMIKLLYKKSITQVNVNGILTEPFEMHRGVKQGCPLSAALYVLAISPLLNKIKNDTRIKGIHILDKKSFKLTAFADDITVIIKNQKEFRIMREHFETYEEVAGAKLNLDKTEGIWMGQNDPPFLDTRIKDCIKVIGLVITKDKCAEINWEIKEQEVENELNQWKIANFKTRIQIVKTFVLSKILFLATVFPPTSKCIQKLNKMCVRFIWGTTREVTKRELLYKPKPMGGLGAVDLGLKLLIAYSKNVSQALERKAVWTGTEQMWQKKKGKARRGVPDYKLVYGDFIKKHKQLNINWKIHTNKQIYNQTCEQLYGAPPQYKHLTETEHKMVLQNLKSKNISENMRDMMWLVSVGRLAVRCVVRWSCYVTTKIWPLSDCNENETVEHLLIECERTKELWWSMKLIGFNVDINPRYVLYGVFNENLPKNTREFYWLVICVINYKLWKTRCKMVLNQMQISAQVLFTQVEKGLAGFSLMEGWLS